MHHLDAADRYERALRLAQRHLRAAAALAAALDQLEDADDLRQVYGGLVTVAGGELRRRRARHSVAC